ncbi:MAG: hypothetical protein Q8R08_04725 [bacterium]|nr:hypothetical protein [bacterium]
MDFIKTSFSNNQQKIALLVGYVLIASLFFSLGKFTLKQSAPKIKIIEPSIDLSEVYNNLKSGKTQFAGSADSGKIAGETVTDPLCTGKIKGNVSSSGKIYHLPNGSFYKRTIAEICFDSEADALAAGFRKSTR